MHRVISEAPDQKQLGRECLSASPALLENGGGFSGMGPVGSELKVLAESIGAARRQNQLVGFRIDAGVLGKPAALM